MKATLLKEMKALLTRIAALRKVGATHDAGALVERLNAIAAQAGWPSPAEVEAA